MACRGVFFALRPEQRQCLLELSSDRERLAYVQDHIEDEWDKEHLLQTDKAWDAIHRCLTDGTLRGGSPDNPLSKLILGGRQLYSDPSRYIINLIEHEELSEISSALGRVTKELLLARYDDLHDTDYFTQAPVAPEDREYTWDYFSDIPAFISKAAAEGRSVIFTVDQ